MSDGATLQDLQSFYGDDFLRYVLFRDDFPGAVEQYAEPQMRVLSFLVGMMNALDGQEPFIKRANLIDGMTRIHDGHTHSLAIELRKSCGGDPVEDPQSGDQIFDILCGYARVAFPVYLLPRGREDLMPWVHFIMSYVLRDPSAIDLFRKFMADDDLKFLFPHSLQVDFSEAGLSEFASVSSLIATPDGSIRSLNLYSLPQTLINAANLRTLLLGERTVDALIESLRDVLSELRLLAKGKEVQVPAVIGLANIDVAQDVEVYSDLGILRRRQESDDEYLFPDSGPRSCILITNIPFKILSKDSQRVGDGEFEDLIARVQEKTRPQREAWQKSLDRISNLQRMALLLSRPEKPYLAATFAGLAVFDPTSEYALRYWRGITPSSQPSSEIQPANVPEIVEWSNRLKRDHPARLDVGLRRIVSAVGDRIDPVDSLVDSVLSWENMFSGSPETNLKVCGSIATLIGPVEFSEREDLFKELRDIYRMRSQIVHGHGDEPSASEVSLAASRAIEVAICSYRKLHDLPELLKIKEASSRSTRILLGGVPELSGQAETDG